MESLKTEVAGDLISRLLVDGAGKLIQAFTAKTGEQVGQRAAEWISVQIWGIKTEDERLFNRAVTLVPPNEYQRLSKRLAVFNKRQADYYRLTVMDADPKVIAATLLNHAQMDDAVWQRHVKTMNLTLDNDDAVWQRFAAWLNTNWTRIREGFVNLGGAITTASNDATAAIVGSGIIATMNDLTQGLLGLAGNNIAELRSRRQNRR
jgi:hypothetical protein